jgi:hypothetical protein
LEEGREKKVYRQQRERGEGLLRFLGFLSGLFRSKRKERGLRGGKSGLGRTPK